jgi:hypothetical protein
MERLLYVIYVFSGSNEEENTQTLINIPSPTSMSNQSFFWQKDLKNHQDCWFNEKDLIDSVENIASFQIKRLGQIHR